MKIKKCWICWRCELGGFGLIFVGWEQNLRGVAAGHQGWIELRWHSPHRHRRHHQKDYHSQDHHKQWGENIARGTTNTLLCSCYISGLEKVLLDLPPITFWHLILLFRPSPEDSGSGWWFWPQTSKYHNSGSNRGPAAGERDHSSTCEQASWIGNAAPAPRYFDSKWKLPTFHI